LLSPLSLHDALPIFGVRPLFGRFILPSEGSVTALNPVIVLGYSFWQTRLGGDPGIVDKTVVYNGLPVTVAGIMPKGFHRLVTLRSEEHTSELQSLAY